MKKLFMLICLFLTISTFAYPQVAKKKAGKQFAATAPAANLSWTTPTVGCTSPQVCTYNVYRGPTSGSETLLTSGVTNTNYQDLAVTRGSTYYYEVTAVNSVGEGPKSNEVSGTIPNLPSAPGSLTVTTQ